MKKDTKRKSFVFYIEWQEVLMEYPAEVRLEVYDAIIEYAASGTLSELKPLAKMAFSFIKKQIDSNNDKYNCLVEKRSEAGRKGMANRYGTSVTNLTHDNKGNTSYQDVTNLTSCNNANYNEPDNVPDNNSLSNAQAREEFSPPDVFDKPLKECYNELASNVSWIEPFVMNIRSAGHMEFTVETFHECLKRFFAKLQNEGEIQKSPKDAMSHFSRWLDIDLKKQEDDKRRAKAFSPTATNPTGKVVRCEAETGTDTQSCGIAQKDYSSRF